MSQPGPLTLFEIKLPPFVDIPGTLDISRSLMGLIGPIHVYLILYEPPFHTTHVSVYIPAHSPPPYVGSKFISHHERLFVLGTQRYPIQIVCLNK